MKRETDRQLQKTQNAAE